MEQIASMIHGPHLYGTTVNFNHVHYKLVFMPDITDKLTNACDDSLYFSTKELEQASITTPCDLDAVSIQKYVKDLSEGDPDAIEMLNTPADMLVNSSGEWDYLRLHRESFYTKSMEGFMRPIRRGVRSYGEGMEEFCALSDVRDFLLEFPEETPLSDIWDVLPVNDYSSVKYCSQRKVEIYSVVDGVFSKEQTVGYILKAVKNIAVNIQKKRERLIKGDADWNEVANVIRLLFEVKDIYEYGRLDFPMEKANYLRAISEGRLDFRFHNLSQVIEDLYEEVLELQKKSTYPEEIDLKQWNQWIVGCYVSRFLSEVIK